MRRQPITTAQRLRLGLAAVIYCAALAALYAWIIHLFHGATR